MKEFLVKAGSWIVKNRRTILTVSTIGGVGVTMLTTVKGTLKAKKELDILEDDFEAGAIEEKDYKKEKAIIVVKNGAIPVACGVATCVGIGTNHKFSTSEIAGAMASVDYISQKYDKLEAKMREKLGEEKTKEIKKEVAQDKIKEDIKSGKITRDTIRQIGKGQQLFIDENSGQIFRSSEGELREKERDFNRDIKGEDWLSENYRLTFFGLRKMGELGEYYGYREWPDCESLTLDFSSGDYIPELGETATLMTIMEHQVTEDDFRSITTA